MKTGLRPLVVWDSTSQMGKLWAKRKSDLVGRRFTMNRTRTRRRSSSYLQLDSGFRTVTWISEKGLYVYPPSTFCRNFYFLSLMCHVMELIRQGSRKDLETNPPELENTIPPPYFYLYFLFSHPFGSPLIHLRRPKCRHDLKRPLRVSSVLMETLLDWQPLVVTDRPSVDIVPVFYTEKPLRPG